MEAQGQQYETLLLLYPVRDAKTSLPDAWGLPCSADRGGKSQNHTGGNDRQTTAASPLVACGEPLTR